ncbi:carboxymuconolactone decarboxylase family protein [Phenylobacterium sp.]|uniref:carboxymuconolactone decarboxylase family protein n=1 Tax=Phenylobacterium sp. TaxID=1871053 RepID=UPI00356AA85A
MTQRLNVFAVAPKALEPLQQVAINLEAVGLETRLTELVKIRASQINGCANCLHMHTADARKAGESEERIYLLDAWRESSMYTPRERAALAWTEALTKISETHAPDADYEALAAQFSEVEIVHLTILVGAINVWNRIAIGLRFQNPSDRRLAAAA